MKKIIPVLSLLLFQGSVLFSQSGIIATVAGNGVAGYSGDGGPATNAELSRPYGICIDKQGYIYCSDLLNNCVRRISTTGIITTFAGQATAGYSGDGGQATAAELNTPSWINVDTSGNLFIPDYGNHCIRKVSNSGIITTVAGNGISGNSGDGGPATAAEMSGPSAVAVDKLGNLYIADCVYSRIRKVSVSTGIISTVAGIGIAGYSGDGGQATAAEIYESNVVTVDDSSNMYISDTWNDVIRKVENSTGIIRTIAGNGFDRTLGAYCCDGGPATAAELYYPESMAIDTIGNIYFADCYNQRIRIINTSSIINTVVGDGVGGYSGDGGPATSAELRIPGSVSLDSKGNLFIADDYNNRIREVTYSTTTSIPKLSTPQLSIYPNPAQNVIYVQLQGGAKAELVEVYNITGQKMQTASLPSPLGEGISFSYAINSSLLSDGIYFLKVQLQDGSTLVKKVEIVR